MLVIGIVLSLLAVVHAFIPMLPIFSVLYGLGAALALLSLLNLTNVWAVRFLAIASTGAMFLYFFGFFRLVQHFHDDWHRGGVALEAIGMLLSAFAMIAVLSVYSSRLKGPEHAVGATDQAIFGVPKNLKSES
ncbi:MAG: hypothetical protein CMP86_04025 [Gammaproteobacteria bacterium]|jgi:hypothetical protein|nr:hypothetical protein [Gammaproteobacteria bacterium]|tara:strand:- start:278 stop:676 length:399 start_codon:yes stop_codon:yes gene_type:complete